MDDADLIARLQRELHELPSLQSYALETTGFIADTLDPLLGLVASMLANLKPSSEGEKQVLAKMLRFSERAKLRSKALLKSKIAAATKDHAAAELQRLTVK